MTVELPKRASVADVHPGDPLYRDLQLRGYNRRFARTPDSVCVVDNTDQMVQAVDAAIASGKRLAALDLSWGVTVLGVATKFWFRSRDGQGDDPTLLLPKRPSAYTMASVMWRWADLDEETFTTLVNNYLHWCERNGSPESPAASVYLCHERGRRRTISRQIPSGRIPPSAGARLHLPLGQRQIHVIDVEITAWTWNLTRATYERTAVISYAQAFADGSVSTVIVRLVPDDQGTCCWFFGRDAAFVNEQIDRYTNQGAWGCQRL